MKRLMMTGAVVLSLIFTLGLAPDVRADGRAAAVIVTLGETSAVGLIDFDQNDFTQAEAQQLTSILKLGALLLPQLLSGQGINLSVNVTVLTPADMIGFGYGDADTANSLIVDNFAAWGFDTYVKAVATKVQPPQGVTGQNIRLDLYLMEGTDSSLQYVASLELPEQLISQLSSFNLF